MKQMKILMLLGNAFNPDPRVLKEAQSLVDNGMDVLILAWDREAKLPETEVYDKIRIKRVRVRSGFGKGIAQVPYITMVHLRFIALGLFQKADIVHCHDLDTLPVGVIIKILKFFSIKIIYDSHENFPVQKALELPKVAYSIMNFLEKLCMIFVDTVFTASSILEEEFSKKFSVPIIWLPNFARKEDFICRQEDISTFRKELGYSKDDIVIAYIGGLRPARAIIPIINVLQKRSKIKMFICGNGEQMQHIQELSKKTSNIKYLGNIRQTDIIPYYFAADVLYYGLINYPGCIYNAPNNFSYAILAGKPLIGTDYGDLGRFIKESKCGIAIKEANERELEKAIERIETEPTIIDKMKKEIYENAQNNYHWGIVESKLLEAYENLQKGKNNTIYDEERNN